MPKLRPNQFLLPSGALITEHPILFQTELVRANLEDRKNQTRRMVNPELEDGKHTPWNHRESTIWQWQTGKANLNYKDDERRCPYGKPGDLLWVKENWSRIDGRVYFQADADIDEILEEYGLEKIRWRPSIHLFKDFSRIWAMVEDIRVERVQDISEEDAMAEGIIRVERGGGPGYGFSIEWNYQRPIHENTAKEAFLTLWISINGQASWKSNPFVWVVKYRILSKTGRPSMEVIEEVYNQIVSPPVAC